MNDEEAKPQSCDFIPDMPNQMAIDNAFSVRLLARSRGLTEKDVQRLLKADHLLTEEEIQPDGQS